jgi:hypothetical protein
MSLAVFGPLEPFWFREEAGLENQPCFAGCLEH